MNTHYELEAIFDGLEQDFPVVNLDVEFVLEGVVDQHTRLYVELVELVVPVRSVGYGDAIPALRVSMTQAITNNLDDAFGEHVRFLLKVHVVLVRVVKGAR